MRYVKQTSKEKKLPTKILSDILYTEIKQHLKYIIPAPDLNLGSK